MNVRNLRVGNCILADLKDSNSVSNRGMVTEIYKNSVKVMNVENRVEIEVPIDRCFEIDLSDTILYKELGFEKHIINQQRTAINTNTINESMKVLFDVKDNNIFFFITFNDRESDGSFYVNILDSSRKVISYSKVKYLHELQNLVYESTKLILC